MYILIALIALSLFALVSRKPAKKIMSFAPRNKKGQFTTFKKGQKRVTTYNDLRENVGLGRYQ